MGNWNSVLLGDSQNGIECTLNLSHWTGGRAGEFIHQFLGVTFVEGFSRGHMSVTSLTQCALCRQRRIMKSKKALGLRSQNTMLLRYIDCAGKSDEEKAKMFITEIRRMNKDMNIPEKFEQIKEADISLIADRALKEGNPLYPVPKIMDKAECVAIIRQHMA